MKKYIPLVLLILGVLVAVAVYFLVIKKPAETEPDDQETLVVLPLIQRPIASLTPSADGHWLKLRIEKMNTSAASVEYELLYDLPDGRTQGVPGTIKLTGQDLIERDLLLGSESSGKFRYDVGVNRGTLTVRFRDSAGKLVNKYTTKFALLSDVKELVSIDEKFSYLLPKINSKDFFVIMETFGVKNDVPADLTSGPIGIFSSATSAVPGEVKIEGTSIYISTASGWTKIEAGKSSDIGIFIGI